MSLASKITFAVTCITSASIVYGVYHLQEVEREALHQGPIKDRERLRLKAEQKTLSESQLTAVQERRVSEYELQKKLQDEYSKVQDVSNHGANQQS